MPRKKEIVAIIPARGGSKGIPHKNVCLLAGKPLIAHTILDARESKYVTRIYVSTDDARIAKVSRKFGADVIDRPQAIAGDKASSESALVHALLEIEKSGVDPDLVVFLQCTSPMRSGKDIDKAIDDLNKAEADSLLSVVESHRFIWEKDGSKLRSINYNYRQRRRRQDMLPQYMENGSIYIFKPSVLKKYNNRLGGKLAISVMDYWSSFEIDTPQDFELCAWLMRKNF